VATKRVHLFVSGDVQGVGFRWFCRDEALERGVGGFVRNLPDGRVEAAFEGDSDAVGALVDWCRSGPRSATVTSMDVQEEDPVGETEFGITR
jgi:acylphosphatase